MNKRKKEFQSLVKMKVKLMKNNVDGAVKVLLGKNSRQGLFSQMTIKMLIKLIMSQPLQSVTLC